jgi:hypothetical protein
MQQLHSRMDSLLCIRRTLEHAYDEKDIQLALEMSNKVDLMQLQLLMHERESEKQAV